MEGGEERKRRTKGAKEAVRLTATFYLPDFGLLPHFTE